MKINLHGTNVLKGVRQLQVFLLVRCNEAGKMRRSNHRFDLYFWAGVYFLLGSVALGGAIGLWLDANPGRLQKFGQSMESWAERQNPTPSKLEAMTFAVLKSISYPAPDAFRVAEVYTRSAQTGGPSSLTNYPRATLRERDNACHFQPKTFGSQTVLTNQDGDRINIRRGPGLEYTAINAGNRDDLVDVLREATDPQGCQWVKVRFGTQVEGWIRADFLNAEYRG